MNKDLEFNMKVTTNSNLDMKIDGSSPIDLDFDEYFKETDPIFKDSPAYTITEEDIIKWNDKSDFSGDYNDLTNKPIIPTKTSQLTNDSGFITKSVNDLEYYSKSSNYSSVAFSGSYTDLSNTPTIPTTTSELNNDSGFITKEVNNLDNYTLSSSLATVATSGRYSDLIGNPTIPNSTSELYNDSGFITKEVNNLDNYTLSSSLANVATSGSYTDLSNTPTIPVVDNSVSTTSNNAVENQAITNYVNNRTDSSTTETVIGTFLSKPLYRKVFNITGFSSSNTDYVSVSSLNIATLVHLYGFYKNSNGTFGIPFYDSDSNYSVIFLSGGGYIRGRFGNATSITEAKVIIEYTKTTD